MLYECFTKHKYWKGCCMRYNAKYLIYINYVLTDILRDLPIN